MIDSTSKRIFKHIAALLAQWREENPDGDERYFGLRLESDEGTIDEGIEDPRPEFVRRDEVGWTRLK